MSTPDPTAARALFDVPLSSEEISAATEQLARPRELRMVVGRSLMVFRVGSERFALPTSACVEVARPRAIHSLPHRRASAVLGLINVRGALRICICLRTLLRLDELVGSHAARRIVVVESEGAPIAFQVDEVFGMHRLDPKDLRHVPATLSATAGRFSKNLFDWQGAAVGLIDEQALLRDVQSKLA